VGEVAGTMQECVGNDLPEAKIYMAVDGLQRPQCKELIELPSRLALQQVHQHIGGDQNFDCGNFH
jgi:hypothetical protein